MWKANKLFYYFSAFAILITGCTSDIQKERPYKDSLEQQRNQDTLKIDEPMQV
ncbi:hypothetical protein MYP_1961 [Sporocytophaga myxococcoides]|uniref:Uncharacterized protein n=1 Tax=Sporocytophaga myxococcoides TaxID=153721 RepID=A0A098LFG1_9BACT|nr:hypothetical protein [Sporocytophaga myxococcoides]GAL84733.1 hypothetical protein MYP_1961 [Sporocytophaga myxococcoides]